MGDGRLHELYLSSCGLTTTQLHRFLEKKPLLSSATKLNRESCCDFWKSTLAPRRTELGVRCGIDVQVGAECEQGQQGLVS